jgi:hypothetical protein
MVPAPSNRLLELTTVFAPAIAGILLFIIGANATGLTALLMLSGILALLSAILAQRIEGIR